MSVETLFTLLGITSILVIILLLVELYSVVSIIYANIKNSRINNTPSGVELQEEEGSVEIPYEDLEFDKRIEKLKREVQEETNHLLSEKQRSTETLTEGVYNLPHEIISITQQVDGRDEVAE